MLEPADVERYNDRVREMRDNMGTYKQLGYVPEFKALQAELAPRGYKACGSLACDCPVKSMKSGFSKHSGKADGLQSMCTKCDKNKSAVSAAAKKRKLEAGDAVDATVTMAPRIHTETEAVDKCLVPRLLQAGLECVVSPEFRRADISVRDDTWSEEDDAYLQVQVKSDGVYKKDRATPKPNDTIQAKYGGGCAQFHQCTGYGNMAMVFTKSRLVDAESGEVHRKIWVVDGAEVTNDTLSENVDGTLGPNRFAPLPTGSAAELKEALDDLVLETEKPLVTRESVWMDVEHKDQRKEMLLMLACKTLGTVEFEAGNQNEVDCKLNDVETQVKVHNLKSGKANTGHCVNGITHQAYSEHDNLKQLLIGCVVKSGGKFYLMHAILSRHVLMRYGVFKHSGYLGRPRSAGTTTVRLLGGIYEKWLTTHTNKIKQNTKWLQHSENKWSAPIELVPDDPVHGLSLELLEEVAQEAHNPAAMPTKEEIDQETTRLNQRILQVASQTLERAEKAAARAEEAAKAGPSTVINNTTNNNITNNYNIYADEPTAKRLCQTSMTRFLK